MAIVTPWQIYPRWVWIVRFLIFALAAAIIALAAYAIHVSKGRYNTLPSLLIFASAKTIIIYGILFATETRARHLIWRLFAYGMYAISIVFWLATWAWSAAHAAVWRMEDCDDGGCINLKDDKDANTEGVVMSICAGFGAAVWVLAITNLVCFIKARKKFTKADEDEVELGVDAAPKYSEGDYGYHAHAQANQYS
ncbi:uncharacterized protein E0L32_007337 [Thyridium curvatum]|uniref:MARVEL domain-containing protein n=1 Tax=Thyridium curvatum TaxID=1093900 RepID=A0A507B005_9PEZI|nr:uncharacterized protein E0L32_007337 [Thyridium curvatum]TPX12034.1 hypothetical protein E0L32_007337 [Thyridium curvatum]